MEEYNKIDWRIRDLDYHEKTHENQFIPETYFSSLYLQSGFVGDTDVKSKVEGFVLPKPIEPYVPGKKLFVSFTNRSLLTKRQHSQCLAALKCLRSGKEPGKYTAPEKANIEIYKALQEKIAQENAKYLLQAKRLWLQRCSHITNLKPSAYKYVKARWRKQLPRFADYKPYYTDLKMVALSYTDDDAPVEMLMTQNLLELGSVAKCTLPTLTCAFTLKLETFPDEEHAVSSKLAVSKDKNIEHLITKHKVDVIISSGGLHRILDNTDFSVSWDIPVIIKEVEMEQGAEKVRKKVVFIDKPLPLPHPTKADFNKICHKLLLRSNLCQFEAFKFPNAETIIESETKEANSTEKKAGHKLHHNVSYRVWRLSNKVENQDILLKTNNEVKTITLLVRTKLDGCESCENGALQPVIVYPKMEYQLDFGGSIATKSELSREWTSLFFRPFSKLYRVRINASNYEVVMNEGCTMQKVNTEAAVHYQYKPHLSLGVLHRICVELSGLEPGNYLLLHSPKHGAFVGILKESLENNENCYNLLKKYESCSPHLTEVHPWMPIDVNLILPMHEAYERMPGLFQAQQTKTTIKVTKSKKKRKGRK